MPDQKLTVGAYLFDRFELMTACGPLDFFGKLSEHISLNIITHSGEPASSEQGPQIKADFSLSNSPSFDIILLPGGSGIKSEVENTDLLTWLQQKTKAAKYVVSVSSGSALLARTGLLDGVRATADKNTIQWVVTQGPKVNWVKQARWTEDQKFFTASGISTGLDMTLTLIKRIFDERTAQNIAFDSGYEWRGGSSWDSFAMTQGLM
ncbi:DJ-1/PfpI family protein [Puniceicoccaceae bacterium K14]|nr:DJ-1/PfpI family protein [Puniceicoccaceae bacterium K14]